MKNLIIYAHPNKTGHCGEYLKSVEKELKKKDYEYEVINLYEENFNPILLPSEHYTSGNRDFEIKVLDYQKKITASKKIILIYPNWWNGVPAILKGFFDRVFTPHFGYKYIKGVPVGLLKGKKTIIFTSTGGPWIYTYFVKKMRFLKSVRNDVLSFCGIKSKAYVLYSANKMTNRDVVNIEKYVKRGMKYLF